MSAERKPLTPKTPPSPPSTADIRLLPENTLGNDIIIGDVHGSLEQLNSVIATLRDQDRLIIVGDLTDRGPDSFGVVKRIIDFNAARKARELPEIQVIHGNHEQLFLDYYLYEKQSLFDPRIGGDWVKSLDEEQLELVGEFFLTLPYIIHVSGAKPFNVVHADMPITDEELLRRTMNGNFLLSKNEKTYAMWARHKGEEPIINTGRSEYSIPTYCGHSIGEGVRKNTNHINLDVGAFHVGCICAVDHQTQTVKIIGNTDKDNVSMHKAKPAKKVKNDITQHLIFLSIIKAVKEINENATLSVENQVKQIYSQLSVGMPKLTQAGYDAKESDVALHKVLTFTTPASRKLLAENLDQPAGEIKTADFIRLDKKIIYSLEEKVKTIDGFLLLQAKAHASKRQCNIRDGYIRALRDITVTTDVFSEETKKALGHYLKEKTNHVLLSKDSIRMFVDSPPTEVSLTYLNRALGLLHLAPITTLEKEVETKADPVVKPKAGH